MAGRAEKKGRHRIRQRPNLLSIRRVCYKNYNIFISERKYFLHFVKDSARNRGIFIRQIKFASD